MALQQLYTNQIEHLAAAENLVARNYVGTFPSDLAYTALTKKPIGHGGHAHYPKFLIANTDPADKPGEHWIGFIIKQPENLEVFDSYGRPLHEYSEELFRFSRHFKTVKENNRQYQSLFSEACGYFCLFFLHYRAKGEKMSSVLSRLHPHNHLNNDAMVERVVLRKMGRNLHQAAPLTGQTNKRKARASFSTKVTDLQHELREPDNHWETRQETQANHGIVRSFFY